MIWDRLIGVDTVVKYLGKMAPNLKRIMEGISRDKEEKIIASKVLKKREGEERPELQAVLQKRRY